MKYKKWGILWNHVVLDWENCWDEMSHDTPQAYSDGPSGALSHPLVWVTIRAC